jgi:hypothetical protein
MADPNSRRFTKPLDSRTFNNREKFRLSARRTRRGIAADAEDVGHRIGATLVVTFEVKLPSAVESASIVPRVASQSTAFGRCTGVPLMPRFARLA